MSPTASLPALVLLQHYGGEWTLYETALYEYFCQDFVTNRPDFRGRKLGLKRHPMEKDKEATFWHFISEGAVESERIPNLRRCERIRWPRPLIHDSESDYVKVWRQFRNGEPRIAIAVIDFSYVVILAERSGQNGVYYLPWTAYCVEKDHQRLKLEKEWSRSKL